MRGPTPEQVAQFESVIGVKALAELRARSRAVAAGTGSDQSESLGPSAHEAIFDLSHALLGEHSQPNAERLVLWMALYAAAPSSAVLFEVELILHRLDQDAATVVWTAYRDALDHVDECIAAPACYSLWAGWLESEREYHGTTESAYAWNRMLADAEPGSLRFNRLMSISGPVRWEVKAPALDRAADDPRGREALLQALLGAAFDVLGQLDVDHARRLLARTPVLARDEHIAALRERLGVPRP